MRILICNCHGLIKLPPLDLGPDVKIEQRIHDHWVFALQCNNLFDEEYDTYYSSFYDATGASAMSGYPGAERSIFFKVVYEY